MHETPRPFVVGSYGGGTNSKGMYIGMLERGEPAPDAILFADTGGEKPETYRDVDSFSLWLVAQGYPAITVVWNVKRSGERGILENELARTNALPSVAYGFKTCSQRFKIRPQDNWIKRHPRAKQEWAAGRKIVKLIGYDFGELGRARFFPEEKFLLRYPLIEWRWDRQHCVDAITRAKLPQPGKSACFFCPNTTKPEILWLRDNHPDLMARALLMENRADVLGNNRKTKGLGRRFAWRDFLAGRPVPDVPDETPCACYDG